MQARYQDGRVGRFVSQDPAYLSTKFDLSNPQSQNSYSYVLNNPLKYNDPTGESAWDRVAGFTNAYVSNNIFGLGRMSSSLYPGNRQDYESGQRSGDNTSLAQAAAEIAGGQAAAGSGAVLTFATAGAAGPVAIPLAVAGEIATLHGTGVAGISAYNLREGIGGSNDINKSISGKIGSGHAFDKHVVNKGEFADLGIETKQQLSNHVENIMNNPSIVKQLQRDRTAYWDSKTNTMVIHDPSHIDLGTTFRSTIDKFKNLK